MMMGFAVNAGLLAAATPPKRDTPSPMEGQAILHQKRRSKRQLRKVVAKARAGITPHQGKREIARRLARIEAGKLAVS